MERGDDLFPSHPSVPSPRQGGEDKPRARKGRLRTLILWAVAAGILVYLGVSLPLDAALGALADTSVPLFVSLVAVTVVITTLTESFSYWVSFRLTLAEATVRYRDVVLIRGACYLFTLVNYAIGQGGIVYGVVTKYRTKVGETAGSVLLVMASQFLVVSSLVGIGLAAGAVPKERALQLVVYAVALCAPLYLMVVWIKPRYLQRFSVARSLMRAGVLGALTVACARVVHTSIWFSAYYLVMRLFGVDVPMVELILRLPLVFLMSGVPITPAGIGTSQAATVLLFSEFAAGASADERGAVVLAASLALHVTTLAVQAVIGLACFRAGFAAPDQESGTVS